VVNRGEDVLKSCCGCGTSDVMMTDEYETDDDLVHDLISRLFRKNCTGAKFVARKLRM
jgi:hypothetical protein